MLETYGEVIRAVIICSAAVGLGVLLGNSAVWFFNRIPGKWLTDYDEEPSEELLHPTQQRIRSTPWKYVFTGFFICCGIYLGLKDPGYAFPALAALWLLLEMSIADQKYMIVPDQLVLLLGVDVKLFGVLGLVTGMDGILVIFVISTFLSAGHFIWLMLRQKAKLTDERAMVPYIAAAAGFYLVFLHDLLYNNNMQLLTFCF